MSENTNFKQQTDRQQSNEEWYGIFVWNVLYLFHRFNITFEVHRTLTISQTAHMTKSMLSSSAEFVRGTIYSPESNPSHDNLAFICDSFHWRITADCCTNTHRVPQGYWVQVLRQHTEILFWRWIFNRQRNFTPNLGLCRVWYHWIFRVWSNSLLGQG